MQITINQTEIENAIRAFINDRMKIEEGIEIVIEFKAGRGPEGYTATIDLVEPTPKVDPTPVATVSRTPRAAKAPLVIQQLPLAVETVEETAQDAAGEAQPETATAVEASAPEPVTAADSGQEEVNEDAPAPTTPPKSLFGNLGRPKNN